MRIKDVEDRVKLTKKSIRYYEDNGLLKPARNIVSGYREYTEDDINTLFKIKYLRELGVSINDLKRIIKNEISLKECMDNQLTKINIDLEKYDKVNKICLDIYNNDVSYDNLDISKNYHVINTLNKEGFTMRDVKSKKWTKVLGAVISSLIFVLLFLIIPVMCTISMLLADMAVATIIAIIVGVIFFILISCIVVNLIERIKEIYGGEEDEASKY